MSTNIDDTQFCEQCESYARRVVKLKKALFIAKEVLNYIAASSVGTIPTASQAAAKSALYEIKELLNK